MLTRILKNPSSIIGSNGLRMFARGSYTINTKDPVTIQFEEKRNNPEFAKVIREIQEKIKQLKSNPLLFSFSTMETNKKDNEKAEQEERKSRNHSVF